jgi:hypothetical protein
LYAPSIYWSCTVVELKASEGETPLMVLTATIVTVVTAALVG